MCFSDVLESDTDVLKVEGQADRTTFLTTRLYRMVYIPTHVLDRIDTNSLFLSTSITEVQMRDRSGRQCLHYITQGHGTQAEYMRS
jgi:hypothetical protein